MAFTRARSVTKFDLYIDGKLLHRTISPVKGLGILFNPKIHFDYYVLTMLLSNPTKLLVLLFETVLTSALINMP